MTTKMCKVSVIMSVYREKPEYLMLAVNSILAQTFREFEYIIVLDDPDNGQAKDILFDFQEKDSRIKIVVNEKNVGLAMALNNALSQASGQFIARMDADDISLPERLEKQVEYLQKHSDCSITGANSYIIDEKGNVINKTLQVRKGENIAKALPRFNVFLHPSIMMKRSDLVSLGGYRNFPAAQDYDLWLRAADEGLKMCNMEECLIKYRINPEGISLSKTYLQEVVAQYIRTLHRERITTGIDTFSNENLTLYLQTYGANDAEEAKKYAKAKAQHSMAIKDIKHMHILRGIIKINMAKHIHPFVKNEIRNVITYKSFLYQENGRAFFLHNRKRCEFQTGEGQT